MAFFPKIEKVARDLTISHFFLMFGYKLFSLYFPLFLIAKGFSLPEIGYNYLLIYLPIAIFAPVVGFLNHKINPAVLAGFGILGYGVYVLGMIVIQDPVLFYLWQVLLGISAALFFASSRAILMGASLKNYDKAFSWFYNAPFYASAIAPIVGAFFIWKFDFIGVFILSLALQFFTAIFCFSQLKNRTRKLVDKGFRFKQFWQNYQKIFVKVKKKHFLYPLLVSFSVLLLAGFYHAFFVLFLKDIGWTQNQILVYGAVFSLVFLPFSFFLIKRIASQKSKKNIFQGSLIVGFFSALLGIVASFLNFFLIILIAVGKSLGGLMASSGRSGFVSLKLKKYPEEAGAMDTIFSPLGTALGALLGGLLIASLNFSGLFLIGGIFVLLIGVCGYFLFQRDSL